jgi:hypothetical protein
MAQNIIDYPPHPHPPSNLLWFTLAPIILFYSSMLDNQPRNLIPIWKIILSSIYFS